MCGADGRNYANPCLAKCGGTTVKSEGACGMGTDACMSCTPVKNTWDPVCLVRTGSGTKAPVTLPSTFSNPCYASCQGAAAKNGSGAVYYKGACKASCDAKCSALPSKPMCCSGMEYPNLCYASCSGGLSSKALAKCSRGQCTGDSAAAMLKTCSPPGSAMANCLRDPCQGLSCPTSPKAVCISSYCPKFFRFEYHSGSCEAIWLNLGTGAIDNSCTAAPQINGDGADGDGTQCAVQGGNCRLPAGSVLVSLPNGQSCCSGLVCYAGPVARPGQINGTCYPENGPFPMGRRHLS